MTEKLNTALEEIDGGVMSTRTGAAMAGKKAIQVVVADLPPSTDKTKIVAETRAGMERLLDEHSRKKGEIDEAYADTLAKLDQELNSQPTLADTIQAAKEELGIE